MVPNNLGLPTNKGNTARNASSPAKPALYATNVDDERGHTHIDHDAETEGNTKMHRHQQNKP